MSNYKRSGAFELSDGRAGSDNTLDFELRTRIDSSVDELNGVGRPVTSNVVQ